MYFRTFFAGLFFVFGMVRGMHLLEFSPASGVKEKDLVQKRIEDLRLLFSDLDDNAGQENKHELVFRETIYLKALVALGMKKVADSVAWYSILIDDEGCPAKLRSLAAYDLGCLALRQGNINGWARRYFYMSAEWGSDKARIRIHNLKQVGLLAKKESRILYEQGEYMCALRLLKIADANGVDVATELASVNEKLADSDKPDTFIVTRMPVRPELTCHTVSLVKDLLVDIFPDFETVD